MAAFYLSKQKVKLEIKIYNNSILTYLRVKLVRFLACHHHHEALCKQMYHMHQLLKLLAGSELSFVKFRINSKKAVVENNKFSTLVLFVF